MDEFGSVGWTIWGLGLGRQVLSIAIAMGATFLLLQWFDRRNAVKTGVGFGSALDAIYDGKLSVAIYYGLRWGLTFLGAAVIMS